MEEDLWKPVVGRYGITRSGEVRGPFQVWDIEPKGWFWDREGDGLWSPEGRYDDSQDRAWDLVAEHVEEARS